MNVSGMSLERAKFLICHSKWAGRTFKTFAELDKLYNVADNGRNYIIPKAPNGQKRKLYTGYMELHTPTRFEDAFGEWYYREGIKQYLNEFGVGNAYQDAWDDCFCEEMFIPVAGPSATLKPGLPKEKVIQTWYAFPQFVPPKNDAYGIRVKNNQVALYAWYSKQMRGFVDIDKNLIQGVTTWQFRDTHEWNHFLSHRPTIEGTYEVSRDGVLDDYYYRNEAFDYKGLNFPPGFVDIYDKPVEVDWWRVIPKKPSYPSNIRGDAVNLGIQVHNTDDIFLIKDPDAPVARGRGIMEQITYPRLPHNPIAASESFRKSKPSYSSEDDDYYLTIR